MKQRFAVRYLKFPPPSEKTRLSSTLRSGEAHRAVQLGMWPGNLQVSPRKKEALYDAIAEAHHSFPCTVTMVTDPETKEPILHIGGFTIREEVKKHWKRLEIKDNAYFE
jgi:hypothetical protein